MELQNSSIMSYGIHAWTWKEIKTFQNLEQFVCPSTIRATALMRNTSISH